MTGAESDPLLLRLFSDWMMQYARFRESDPALATTLQQSEDFVAIPVPRALLSHLRTDEPLTGNALAEVIDNPVRRALDGQDEGPTPADSGAPDQHFELRTRPQGPAGEAWDAVSRLLDAIGSGELEPSLACFSSRYADPAGRTVEDVQALLRQHVTRPGEWRCVLQDLGVVSLDGDLMEVAVTVSYERIGPELQVPAAIGGGRAPARVRLRRHEDAGWKVECIRLS